MFSVTNTVVLETFHKDDSVIVNWSMGLAIAFMGALINLITGKVRDSTHIEAGKVTDMTVNTQELKVKPGDKPQPIENKTPIENT